MQIAGCGVVALRHGMAGHKGVELSGPYDEMEIMRAALLHAGESHGLQRGGTQAYFSTPMESGWMAYPVPGVFTGGELRGFPEWLPADEWDGNEHLGGSFYASDILPACCGQLPVEPNSVPSAIASAPRRLPPLPMSLTSPKRPACSSAGTTASACGSAVERKTCASLCALSASGNALAMTLGPY